MSKRNRILGIVGLSLAGLIIVAVVASILTIRTAWFQNYVREKIIAVTEESTGGKVEIGSFAFDWTHLRATIRNFVLHGTEPAGQAPLFRASLIQLDLRLFSGLKKMVDLQSLDVDQPQANLLIYPNGNTNVPEPKVKSNSNTSGLETVVDLAIGHFNLTNGLLAFNAEKAKFSAKGENLRAQLAYNAVKPQYQGHLSMSPLCLQSDKNESVNANVNLPVTLEKDRITLSGGKLTTGVSEISVDGSVDHMNAPKTSAHLNARVGFDDVRKLVDVPIQSGKGLP
ncbi:MAG: hypothetical protein JO022_11905, partial [Acidobacteriaceae bacterium]|nr:hypothetical protein [Acidobacteriaceae bacterium]